MKLTLFISCQLILLLNTSTLNTRDTYGIRVFQSDHTMESSYQATRQLKRKSPRHANMAHQPAESRAAPDRCHFGGKIPGGSKGPVQDGSQGSRRLEYRNTLQLYV